MPPSSDRPSQEPLLNLDPDLQVSGRKRSPGRKKNRRKNESTEEIPGGGGGFGGFRAEMTSPSSILAQLHKSSSPPVVSKSNPSPPAFDNWNAAPSQYSEAPITGPTEWASNIPFGRSPPDDRSNGISIAGSPPQHHLGTDGLRDGVHQTSPPTSPRSAYRQLVRRNNEYQSFGNHLGSSPNSRRPPSVHSQYPPPHQPQAHFYGAPELDFGMPWSSSKQGEPTESTCCVFDSLSSTHDGRDSVWDILLVGANHGLDVFHVDKKKLEQIGRLAGLRGPVLHATVLPNTSSARNIQAVQPLVAITVHGPAEQASRDRSVGGEQADFEPSDSMIGEAQTADPDAYETTVEIYSLKNGRHVQTLFQSPRVEVERRHYGARLSPPSPTADISVATKGRFLVISSGKSGEVFIFEARPEAVGDLKPLHCIGKVWTKTTTRLPRSLSISSNDSDPSGLQELFQTNHRQSQTALLSLSSRWLAIVPPASSAQTSLHGSVISDQPVNKIHGVSSHASPGEPQVTCQLDTPDAESFLNKVARDGAQTLMKGAQWVGSQGMQAWNNYWAKPPEQGQQRYSASVPSTAAATSSPGHLAFPPTHAQDSKTSVGRNQAALVSILDLEKLSKSQHLKSTIALEPIATFSLSTGCSLVSFAPDGLKLLTASSKGDVQQVWDLMRMIHGETGRHRDLHTEPKGPTVREVARFTRITEAKIIDVIWSESRGARLAVVTDRGTVHIYDMPASAFQWPPLRRSSRSSIVPAQRSSSSDPENPAPQSQTTTGSISSAFGMLSSTTQPILAAVRGRRPSTGSTFPAFGSLSSTAGIGAKGSKAVAAGVNRSVSAAAVGTYNTIRHLGENRIALPSSNTGIQPGCVRWLNGKDQGSLAVTGGGLTKVYGIHQSSNTKAGKRRPSVLGDKPTELKVPRFSTSTYEDLATDPSAAEEGLQQHYKPNGSFWHLASSRPSSRTSTPTTHPLSFAEIDTSAAYQPFHTDRRVNLYTYNYDPRSSGTVAEESPSRYLDTEIPAPSSKTGTGMWLFGQTIPTTKISSGSANYGDRDGDGNDLEAEGISKRPHRGNTNNTSNTGEMESVVSVARTGGVGGNDGEEHQQIVVTTRRKKKKLGRGVTGADIATSSTATAAAAVPSESDLDQLPTGQSGGNPPPKPAGIGLQDDEIFEDDCEVVDFADERV